MRYIVLLFFVGLMSTSICAQKIEFNLDYTATYLLSKSQDTITFSVGDGGKYLFTDSKAVTKKFSKSFSKLGLKEDDPSSQVMLLINMSNLDMFMYVKAASNVIAATVNMENFLPKKPINNETAKLISESTGETINIIGHDFPVVAIFPNDKPEEKIYAAFDNNYDLNYNQNFNHIFKNILGKNIEMDVPNGAIVYLKEKSEILRLLHIKKDKKKGAMDFSLTIE